MMISWPRWAASTATSLRQRRRWRPLRLTSRRAICLSLFEREYFAPVRVSPNRLDREHKIFQIDRRERTPLFGDRESIPDCPLPTTSYCLATRHAEAARFRPATICDCPRRLLLLANLALVTLFRGSLNGWTAAHHRRAALQ